MCDHENFFIDYKVDRMVKSRFQSIFNRKLKIVRKLHPSWEESKQKAVALQRLFTTKEKYKLKLKKKLAEEECVKNYNTIKTNTSLYKWCLLQNAIKRNRQRMEKMESFKKKSLLA